MGSTVEPPLARGEVVADKYRVVSELGRGGMGLVYEAVHEALGHSVAIKVLGDPLNDTARRRFRREAQVVATLQSPHLARVFDVGHLPSGAPYMVMEFLDGETLSARLARGPLAVAEAVDAMLQVCEAVAEAHRAGVVHRDLKPSNVFIAQSLSGTTVKVLDFGIARVMTETELTGTGERVGSPRFMAPEQLTQGPIHPSTDVWALGLMLHEMLSGRPAFQANNIAELTVLILQDEPNVLEGIEAELSAVVRRCLQKEASRRYASVAALAEALGPWGGESAHARIARIRSLCEPMLRREPAPPLREHAQSNDTTVGSPPTTTDQPVTARDKRGRWLALIAAAGAVGFTVLSFRDAPPTRSKMRDDAPSPTPSSTPSGISPPVSSSSAPATTASAKTPDFVVEGLGKLPAALADARRRAGKPTVRSVYADDSRIAIVGETVSGSVVQYVYRNGTFDREETPRLSPGPGFTPVIEGAWLGRIIDDAVARAADPGLALVTFKMVAVPAPPRWTGADAAHIDIEVILLGDGNRELHYDTEGRFVCAVKDGAPACPPVP